MLGEAVDALEIIESYLDDKYLPGFLLRGECQGTVFHAQVATDVEGGDIKLSRSTFPGLISGIRGFELGGCNHEMPNLRRPAGAPRD